jgi:hypothetical protein
MISVHFAGWWCRGASEMQACEEGACFSGELTYLIARVMRYLSNSWLLCLWTFPFLHILLCLLILLKVSIMRWNQSQKQITVTTYYIVDFYYLKSYHNHNMFSIWSDHYPVDRNQYKRLQNCTYITILIQMHSIDISHGMLCLANLVQICLLGYTAV